MKKVAAAAAGSVVEWYCHLYYRWNWWVWAELNAYAIGFGGEVLLELVLVVLPLLLLELLVELGAAVVGCGERTGDTDTPSVQSKASSTLDRGLEHDEEPPELTTLLPHSFFSLPDSMPESVACDPTKSKSALESPDEPELARVRKGQVPESVAASRGAEEAKDEGWRCM
uniref:Uncharacterized protein n=1 Tax=Glossina palpalis gambiensis TaxID=67801 RepID=A0A1B0BNB0_9MUSC